MATEATSSIIESMARGHAPEANAGKPRKGGVKRRRPPREGSLVEVKKGVWRLRATLQGERKQLRRTIRGNQTEAQLALRKLLAETETVEYPDLRVTVATLARRWLEMARLRVGQRTAAAYEQHIELYIVPKLDPRGVFSTSELRELRSLNYVRAGRSLDPTQDQRLRELEARRGTRRLRALRRCHVEDALSAWVLASRSDGEVGQLSQRTVHHIYCTLRAILRWAVTTRQLAYDPSLGVPPPRVEHREMASVSMGTVAALLRAAEGTELQAPVAAAVGTGLRRGELLGLRWTDIDFESGRLTVRRSIEVVKSALGHYERREKPPKTARSARTIALAPSVIGILRRQRADQLQRRLLLQLPRDDGAYVFDRADGTPWGPGAFSLAFARLVKRAELPHFRFHDLRHTFATASLLAGIDLKTVSASLGHAEIGTTGNIYAHVQQQLQERHASKVETVMGNALAVAVGDPQQSVTTERKSRVSHERSFGKKKARGYGLSMVAPTGIEPVFPP